MYTFYFTGPISTHVLDASWTDVLSEEEILNKSTLQMNNTTLVVIYILYD